MNVLQVGSDSIHLSHFCAAIHHHTGNFDFVTETNFQPKGIRKMILAPFRSNNPWQLISNYRDLKKEIQKSNPDLIHIHQVNRLAFVVCRIAKKLNIPVITTAWGSDVLIIPQKNRIFKAITRSVLETSAYVTGDSNDMIEAMQAICPSEDKYIRLQYGIDPVSPGNKENIVFSNRLHKEIYRIDLIINLFAEFYSQHPEWKLVIGASGPLEDSHKALAKALLPDSAYEFIGWVSPEINAKHYAKSRIYASLPLSDGTSVSLLESMSANCIPVLSDLPVSREWIFSGKNGIIFDGKTNPFEAALTLDEANCFKINQEIIQNEALRTSTIPAFFNLYQKILS